MKEAVSGCPIEDAMRLLSGRWRTLLIYYLSKRPKRFSELRRDNPRISQRMLTLELRTLEDAGVVSRTVHPGRLAHVEYELTEAGRKLIALIDALGDWWEDLDKQRRAQAVHEATAQISARVGVDAHKRLITCGRRAATRATERRPTPFVRALAVTSRSNSMQEIARNAYRRSTGASTTLNLYGF